MKARIKFFRVPRILLLLLIVLIEYDCSISQVAVERSKYKVVISGIPYYIHTVKKGETAYSISKAYGLTVDELVSDNPSSGDGLNEGENLRIPVSKVSAPQPIKVQPYRHPVRDESRFLYHILKQGETVYSLSKTYGVTEAEITKNNPGIDISKIPVGSEIAIPREILVAADQKQPDQKQPDQKQSEPLQPELKQPEQKQPEQKKPIQETVSGYHKVVRGETMSSIASKYGITLRELRRLNRGVRFPQVGDYLVVPGIDEEIPEKDLLTEEADTIPDLDNGLYYLLERPDGYTPVNNLRGSLNVAVLLPFYLEENAQRYEVDTSRMAGGKRSSRVYNRSDDWIYPGTLGFLQMYEGILLAADTLRSLGLDINISAYDIKGDTIGISGLIGSGRLDRMDLIIGPVHSANLAVVSRFAQQREIPVVSPVSLMDNSQLINNPVLFLANSSLKVAQNAIAGKLTDYADHNIVVIHSDTAGGAKDLWQLRESIITELSGKIPQEEIKYKELMFYSRSVYGADSARRLVNSLSDKTGNVIIVASEEPPLMSETLMDIHSLLRRFDIKVLGYPYMRSLDNLDPRYLFDLNLMIFSPYWIDFSSEDVKQFNTRFRNTFRTQPSETSFAWEGFDIAYYFLSGLAIHGKQFILHPEIHNPDLLQTKFEFRRKTFNDGFENQKLFLIKFTNDYEVILVDETEIPPVH